MLFVTQTRVYSSQNYQSIAVVNMYKISVLIGQYYLFDNKIYFPRGKHDLKKKRKYCFCFCKKIVALLYYVVDSFIYLLVYLYLII